MGGTCGQAYNFVAEMENERPKQKQKTDFEKKRRPTK
jgi:hypothetical protein